MLARIKERDPDVLRQFYQRSVRPTKHPLSLAKKIHWKLLEKDLRTLHTNTLDIHSLKKVPQILLIHGSKDAIVCPSKSKEIHQKLPNSTLLVLNGAGHALHLTHSNDCLRAILKFLPKRLLSFKMQLAHNFSKAHTVYHQEATFQKHVAGKVLDSLSEQEAQNLPTKNILEIGCGSGFLTERLLGRFEDYSCHISDLSPTMVQACKKSMEEKSLTKNHPQFNVLDAERIDNGFYSLIVSSMTFQWFECFLESVENLFSRLSNGGILLFSFMEDQSFCEWKDLCLSQSIPFTRRSLPKEKDLHRLAKKLDSRAQVVTKKSIQFTGQNLL